MSRPKNSYCRILLIALLPLILSEVSNPALAGAQLLPRDLEPDLTPSQLLILLSNAPDSPSPDEVLSAYGQGHPLPAGLDVGQPGKVRFLISRRIRGEALEALLETPDSPRALLQRYLVFDYADTTDLEQVLETLRNNPRVLHAYRSRVFQLFSSPVHPDDPLFPVQSQPQDYQWGIHTLNLPEAWSYAKGHAYVGIIDTGLDVDHEDLVPFAPNGTFIGGNFRGHLSYDFGDDDPDVNEGDFQSGNAGHGTHVAGIIAASTNNEKGVSGVCWNCSLLMQKMFNASGNNPWEPNIVESFMHLLDSGAQVINMSFGQAAETRPDCKSSSLDAFCMMLDEAEARDVASFAAAGNFLQDLSFPASDERVISVGGLEPSSSFWDFRDGDPRSCPSPQSLNQCGSNWTQSANVARQDFVAPAVDVLSTFYVGGSWNPTVGCVDHADPTTPDPNPGYGLCTGTSMSAPHGTGLGGLLRSINPLLNKTTIRSVINDHADRSGVWDPQLGYGVPDAAASARAILGNASGSQVHNRLTPLFQLFSSQAGDYAYTTVPQYASALTWADEQYISRPGAGSTVEGYSPTYPGGQQCPFGPCEYEPQATVFIFTSDRSPNGHPLVPLYRLSLDEPRGGNPENRDHNYTTEGPGIEYFRNEGYRLDGVEGYIYERCSPEPSCIPTGAVRLYRLHHAERGDWAIFPESQLATFVAEGYEAHPCCNDWIGYVYENVNSDEDQLIDGFERLLGTDPAARDTDCDGVDDSEEFPLAGLPASDPLDGSCSPQTLRIEDTFSENGPLDGRQTETGGAIWTARKGAVIENGQVIDRPAIGTVPLFAHEDPEGSILELSARVNPGGTQWNAIGFAREALKSFGAVGELWVRLRPDNVYFIHARDQVLRQGSVPGSPTGGFHQVVIRFAKDTDRATVWINGTELYDQTLPSSPTIHVTGFHMRRAQEFGGQIDDFEVREVSGQSPTLLIADTFEGDGALQGRPTEVGSRLWRALEGAVTQFGRVFDSAAIAGVPLDLEAHVGGKVTLEADVEPPISSWAGIGFARQAAQPLGDTGELWVLLYSSGFYVVRANGSVLATGIHPDTSPGEPYRVAVSYDSKTRRAQITIDDIDVLAQVLLEEPDIRVAGFQMYGAGKGSGSLDNFSVELMEAP